MVATLTTPFDYMRAHLTECGYSLLDDKDGCNVQKDKEIPFYMQETDSGIMFMRFLLLRKLSKQERTALHVLINKFNELAYPTKALTPASIDGKAVAFTAWHPELYEPAEFSSFLEVFLNESLCRTSKNLAKAFGSFSVKNIPQSDSGEELGPVKTSPRSRRPKKPLL